MIATESYHTIPQKQTEFGSQGSLIERRNSKRNGTWWCILLLVIISILLLIGTGAVDITFAVQYRPLENKRVNLLIPSQTTYSVRIPSGDEYSAVKFSFAKESEARDSSNFKFIPKQQEVKHTRKQKYELLNKECDLSKGNQALPTDCMVLRYWPEILHGSLACQSFEGKKAYVVWDWFALQGHSGLKLDCPQNLPNGNKSVVCTKSGTDLDSVLFMGNIATGKDGVVIKFCAGAENIAVVNYTLIFEEQHLDFGTERYYPMTVNGVTIPLTDEDNYIYIENEGMGTNELELQYISKDNNMEVLDAHAHNFFYLTLANTAVNVLLCILQIGVLATFYIHIRNTNKFDLR